MKFGKLAARHDERTLKLSAYLPPTLEAPPDHYNALPRVEQATKVTEPKRLFPMLGNDRYGCCTIAACAHAETVWEAFAGKKRVPTRKAVLADYFLLSGGADSGLYELDVLNHWRKVGITGERILAYVSVNFGNHERVKQAISLFGGLYIGFTVQDDCLDRFDRREMWEPAPLTNSGHAVYVYAYTSRFVSVLTWGNIQRGSWQWWDQCVDEAYAIIPGEATLEGFAPGIDYEALKQDLIQVQST